LGVGFADALTLGFEGLAEFRVPGGLVRRLRLRPCGVGVAGEGVVKIGEEVGDDVPAGFGLAELPSGGGLGREVVDQDREATEREPAAPEVREVDAVEAEEVSLYGAAIVAE
jgi:hypothetical protein